ncbi:unnamed protein product [Trichobilharzia regenti]|nr:unnamed protein product [Trichobilharzia regenti]
MVNVNYTISHNDKNNIGFINNKDEKLCTSAGFCLCHPQWNGNACETEVVNSSQSTPIHTNNKEKNTTSSSSSQSSIPSMMTRNNPLNPEVIQWIWNYLEQMQQPYTNPRDYQMKRQSRFILYMYVCV